MQPAALFDRGPLHSYVDCMTEVHCAWSVLADLCGCRCHASQPASCLCQPRACCACGHMQALSCQGKAGHFAHYELFVLQPLHLCYCHAKSHTVRTPPNQSAWAPLCPTHHTPCCRDGATVFYNSASLMRVVQSNFPAQTSIRVPSHVFSLSGLFTEFSGLRYTLMHCRRHVSAHTTLCTPVQSWGDQPVNIVQGSCQGLMV